MGKFASELTKEDLIKSGITNITQDGKVFRNGKQVKFNIRHSSSGKFSYLVFQIYKFDANGKRIKVPRKFKYTVSDGSVRICDGYSYDLRTIALSRAMWAWYNGIVKAGYVIDHIDNSLDRLVPENNSLDKLQMITNKENLTKDKKKKKWGF